MRAPHIKRGIIGLLTAGLLVVAAGCGSDKATDAVLGSLSDPDFAEVQSDVNKFVDSTIVAFTAALGAYNEVPQTGGDIEVFYGPINPGSGDNAAYEYTAEGWHHITITATGTKNIVGVNDSIQFKDGSTVQEDPQGADFMDYRHHWAVTAINQSADYKNYRGDAGFVFEGLDTDEVTITGGYEFMAVNHSEDTVSETDNTLEIAGDYSAVKISQPASGNWSSGCPSSGEISFSISQTKIVAGQSSVDTSIVAWTGSVTFTSGLATVSMSNGSTNWVYSSNVCTPAN